MALSCGMNILKALLFIFNFIFWLLGVAVLAVGIWSRVDGGSWETLVEDTSVVSAANMMIASGVIVAIIGFLGCCGAMRKSQCMLVSYAILIFLIFVLEVAAGIYAYTKKDVLQKELEIGLKKVVNTSYNSSTKADQALTKSVDWFQQNVKCCGLKGPEDWTTSEWYTNKTKGQSQGVIDKIPKVPESCCVTKRTGCNEGSITKLKNASKIHAKGCIKVGKDFVKNHLWKVGGAAIGIGVIELLGIIFAVCLCRAIRDEEKGSSA